jgi:ADP-ribose pyrophosphatase
MIAAGEHGEVAAARAGGKHAEGVRWRDRVELAGHDQHAAAEAGERGGVEKLWGRGHEQHARDARVARGGAQRGRGAEGVAAREQLAVQRLLEVLERGRVVFVGVLRATARRPPARADATPVEAQRCDPGLLEGVGELVHDGRLHAAAVQRMGRSDHGCVRGRAFRHSEEDAVERASEALAGNRDGAFERQSRHRQLSVRATLGDVPPPRKPPRKARRKLARKRSREVRRKVPNAKPVRRGFRVEATRERVELPNGTLLELDIVRHPGAAAVVPFVSERDVLLIRQYRHAAGGMILEVPAGKLEAGEAPEACAARELVEEAGQRPGRLLRTGAIWTTPGFTDERIHLFAAFDLTAVPRNPDDDELIEVLRLPLAAALELVWSGELSDAKSALALVHAARHKGLLA